MANVERARRTEAEKKRLVTEWLNDPHGSREERARRLGVNTSLLYKWAKGEHLGELGSGKRPEPESAAEPQPRPRAPMPEPAAIGGRKYRSPEEKRRLGAQFLADREGPVNERAERIGVSKSLLYQWARGYFGRPKYRGGTPAKEPMFAGRVRRTEEEKRKLVEAWLRNPKEGGSGRERARRLGLSSSTLGSWAIELGMPRPSPGPGRRPTRRSTEFRARVLRETAGLHGAPLAARAHRLGISASTVYIWRKQEPSQWWEEEIKRGPTALPTPLDEGPAPRMPEPPAASTIERRLLGSAEIEELRDLRMDVALLRSMVALAIKRGFLDLGKLLRVAEDLNA